MSYAGTSNKLPSLKGSAEWQTSSHPDAPRTDDDQSETAALLRDTSRATIVARSFSIEELRQDGPGKAARYESLDYEEVENTVYRADKAAGTTLDSLSYSSLKWIICFLIGVTTALAAFTVNLSVENISGFKFWATFAVVEQSGFFASFLVYALINATLVLASVAITMFIGPAAAGSGIADVKAYLNGIDVPGIFYFNTLVAKVLGAIGSVAGGLAIGKEGPFVHAGACIAAILSQGGTLPHTLPFFKRLWNDRDRNDMVACGAAAGVAAAFRSPVGGVLFALEEMTSWWKNHLMWLIFFTTAVVSVTVRVLMKACSRTGCGFFGSGGFIIFEISEGQDNYEFYELLPVLLLGVVGGLLGSSFITLNAKLNLLRKQHLTPHGVRGKMAEALLISLITSIVSFCLPLMVHCQACPADAASDGDCPRQDNSHSGNFVSFGCKYNNQYNDLATIFFNTQDDAIRNLFSSKTKQEYSVTTLVAFVTCFYFLAVITYGMSCPTGFFVPSILCGAAYGRLVGIFVADMSPHHYIDEGTYALLGAASFLGGSMRMTVCTCVMLLELTNNLALLPLIMLVLLVAKAVGDGTGVKPLYEVHMEVKGMPFLGPSPESYLRHITAKECCGKPPVTFQRVEKVHRIVDVLRGTQHNGFPVIYTNAEGERNIMGVVLRQHLLVLLSTPRCLQPSSYIAEVSSRVATSYDVSEFTKPISTPGLSIHDVQLTPEQLDLYLDLGPYVNPSYYVVQEDASLSKVYTLFRTLGLRHLCVIPRAPDVVGIITRRDLLPETIDDRFEMGGQYTTDGTTMVTNGLAPAPDNAEGLSGNLLNRRSNRSNMPQSSSSPSLMNYHFGWPTMHTSIPIGQNGHDPK
mmetsp:Transcript_23545/g.51672  ORF Transcript_23545/g.51672 Transcript_23545/m.51672 type:complete len:861 (+) Transcript_23545:337-2919(+)